MIGESVNKLGEIKAASTGAVTRIEQSVLVKKIGTRMREARELNNMSQSVAARRLGYKNSSKLAKIENASDTNSVPLSIIARAAKLYDVSTDYIFGASDDWESGSRKTQDRNVAGWMHDMFARAVGSWGKMLGGINDKIECVTSAFNTVPPAIGDVSEALHRFRELNPEFDDMRGGSTLVAKIDRAEFYAKNATVAMRRFHCEMRVAASNRVPYVGDPDSPIKDLFAGKL